jgi:hypothetical protein
VVFGVFMFRHPGTLTEFDSPGRGKQKVMEAALNPMDVVVAELFKVKARSTTSKRRWSPCHIAPTRAGIIHDAHPCIAHAPIPRPQSVHCQAVPPSRRQPTRGVRLDFAPDFDTERSDIDFLVEFDCRSLRASRISELQESLEAL